MSFTRKQTVFTFQTQNYQYDVVIDAQSQVSVRNIRGPFGQITGTTEVPEVVMTDIREAMTQVALMVAESEAFSETLTFTGQTEQSFVFPAGTFNNANYRVLYTNPAGFVFTSDDLTVTGFTAIASAACGSVETPIDVPFSVLVSALNSSSFSGTVTFTHAAPEVAIVFPQGLSSSKYRVITSPNGFFQVSTINQTKRGFALRLGYVPAVGETVTVGYDVFV